MIIDVAPSFEYGNVRYYPSNTLADLMLAITKRKSFTKTQLHILMKAGFTINVTNPKHNKLFNL